MNLKLYNITIELRLFKIMFGLGLQQNEFYISCKVGVGAGQGKHFKRSG